MDPAAVLAATVLPAESTGSRSTSPSDPPRAAPTRPLAARIPAGALRPRASDPKNQRRRPRSCSIGRSIRRQHLRRRSEMDNPWAFMQGFGNTQPPQNMSWMQMMQMPLGEQGQGHEAHSEPLQSDPIEQPSPSQRPKSGQKGKLFHFSVEEDKVLISCWLNVSLDPVTGAGQRKASFWRTIEQNYNEQKSPTHPVRTLRSLEGRWADIKEQANKFESHYMSVLHENRSGYNDMDKVTAAVTLYNSIEKKPMTTLHCWEILRNEPKWLDLQRTPTQARCGPEPPIDLTDGGVANDASGSHTTGTKRPIGRDSAKSAKRASSTATPSAFSTEYTSLLRDLRLERLGAYKQVDGLMATNIEKLVNVQEKAIKQRNRLDKQIVQMKKKKWDALTAKEEERIISLDVSSMNPVQREYYEAKQQEILQRIRARHMD